MTGIKTHRFPNGLKLVLEKLPNCRSVGVAVGFPAGGRNERPEISGISHYLEHMIFKGTESIKNVDKVFEGLGASNNAITDVDSTVYLAECPKEKGVEVLRLWLRILSEASIDRKEFERERGVIISEYFISEDNPDFLVYKNATMSLFKGHPLASTVIGSEETIRAISHEDMVNYFRSLYHPANSVIWISGDLEIEELANCVEEQEAWTERYGAPSIGYTAFEPKSLNVLELKRPMKLVQVGLAFSSPTNSAEERAAFQILCSMLSAGQSSLLRRKLTLEREITDRLHTSISSYYEGGMFLTSFAIQPSVIKETRALLAQSLCDLRENPNKFRQDFERAQSHAVGSLSVGIDRRMMRRALDGAWETLRRGKCSWDELMSSLELLEFEQFTEVMTEITREGRMTLVLAGDV